MMRCLAMLAFLAFAAMSQSASALTYQGRPAPGGDCSAGDARWYGELSGNHFDDYRDISFPVSQRGCFTSERACRRWLNEAMSFTGQGAVLVARCVRR